MQNPKITAGGIPLIEEVKIPQIIPFLNKYEPGAFIKVA